MYARKFMMIYDQFCFAFSHILLSNASDILCFAALNVPVLLLFFLLLSFICRFPRSLGDTPHTLLRMRSFRESVFCFFVTSKPISNLRVHFSGQVNCF